MLNIIPKEKLINGAHYIGVCRHGSVGLWDEKNDCFQVIKNQFMYYMDSCPHFDDVKETSIDGFVPIEAISGVYEKYLPNEVVAFLREIGYKRTYNTSND